MRDTLLKIWHKKTGITIVIPVTFVTMLLIWVVVH